MSGGCFARRYSIQKIASDKMGEETQNQILCHLVEISEGNWSELES